MHARPEQPHNNVKGIGKNSRPLKWPVGPNHLAFYHPKASRPRSILLALLPIQHCFYQILLGKLMVFTFY